MWFTLKYKLESITGHPFLSSYAKLRSKQIMLLLSKSFMMVWIDLSDISWLLVYLGCIHLDIKIVPALLYRVQWVVFYFSYEQLNYGSFYSFDALANY